jgi:hypothetical protein
MVRYGTGFIFRQIADVVKKNTPQLLWHQRIPKVHYFVILG